MDLILQTMWYFSIGIDSYCEGGQTEGFETDKIFFL